MMFLKRLRQRPLDAVAKAVQANVENFLSQPHPFGPCGHRHGQSAIRQELVESSVPALFFLCGPSDISGFVVTVVVDAVKRVVWRRARPNVPNKHSEIIPLTAHRNAAPSVVVIAGGFRILAASAHASPTGVLGWKFSFLGKSVRDCSALAKIGTKPLLALAASAITRAWIVLNADRLFISAFTSAQKAASVDLFEHDPSAVFVSGSVYRWRHVEPLFYRTLNSQIRACAA